MSFWCSVFYNKMEMNPSPLPFPYGFNLVFNFTWILRSIKGTLTHEIYICSLVSCEIHNNNETIFCHRGEVVKKSLDTLNILGTWDSINNLSTSLLSLVPVLESGGWWGLRVGEKKVLISPECTLAQKHLSNCYC